LPYGGEQLLREFGEMAYAVKRLHWIFLVVAGAVAIHGLVPALVEHKLVAGHDTAAYAIYATEFHENIRSGNWFPIWAADLRFGHGEPHLAFRPPLQLFLTEFIFTVLRDPITAVNWTMVVILLGALAAMYAFLRDHTTRTVAALGASVYGLSPYLLRDVYIRGALSEATAFVVLPLLALTSLRLIRRPSRTNFIFYALSWALLASCHAAILLIATPFFVAGILIYYKSFGLRKHSAWQKLLAGFLFGLGSSSFYWLSALLEQKHVASPLIGVDFEAYIWHFKQLTQILFSSFTSIKNKTLAYNVGEPILFALLLFPFVAWRNHVSRLLALGMVIVFYFMHQTSAIWYELLPWLQSMTYPWRFLTMATFLGALLFSCLINLQAKWIEKKVAITFLIFLSLTAFGFIHAKAPALYTFTGHTFSPSSLASTGTGWAKPYTVPASTGFMPTSKPESWLDFVSGRGEAQCKRPSPTRIFCEVMAIQPAIIRFNVLDYPGWTVVRENTQIEKITEPGFGRILVELPHGKQTLELILKNTGARWFTKTLSILSFLGIFVLVFFRKATFASLLSKARR